MWNSVQSDDPYQRDNLPFAELMSLALGLLRSEYQLWSGTLPMNEESMAIFVGICDAVVAEMQRSFMPLLSDAAAKARAGATLVIRQVTKAPIELIRSLPCKHDFSCYFRSHCIFHVCKLIQLTFRYRRRCFLCVWIFSKSSTNALKTLGRFRIRLGFSVILIV